MEQLQEAQRLLDAKKYQEALKRYLYIMKQKPEDALIYQGIALCQYNLGQYDAAIESSKKAVEFDSELSIPHTILAFIYGRNGNLVESSREATIALDLAPHSFEALNCYGTVLIAERKYLEAETFLQKALYIKPDSLQTHQNLAIAYENIGDARKFLETTKKLFKLRPSLKTGFQLFVAFHRRYALLISISTVGLLAFIMLFRAKILLVIPSIYLAWGLYICYHFAKMKLWRNTITYFVATILYAILLFNIYTLITIR